MGATDQAPKGTYHYVHDAAEEVGKAHIEHPDHALGDDVWVGGVDGEKLAAEEIGKSAQNKAA